MNDRKPEKPSWFAGREVLVLFYKVNRWPIAQDSFLTERIEDPLEHFSEVLLPGEPVTTGRRFQRTWFVGDLNLDRDRRILTGQVGWERPDQVELGEFDRELNSWVDHVSPAAIAAHAPFVYDGETGRLAVLKHPKFAARTIPAVFDQLLNRGEDRRGRTALWGVEPLLEEGSFEEWLEVVDSVQKVTFVARLPNPDMLPEFQRLVERLEAREAKALHEQWEARDPSRGLQGIQDDEDASQMIAMAESGFGYITAQGTSEGRGRRFEQRQRIEKELTPALPATVGEMTGVVIDFILARLRRRKQ